MTAPIDQDARDTIRTQFAETLFVEAGAGTGKTTALVARVIHMVATGHLAVMSELAAITFTENAAAELRNRIREGLQPDAKGRYAGFEYDPAAQVRLAAGLETLDDAVLTTLHGFASRILSEASLEAGLPPSFSVADTGAGTEDAERSWSDFVDRLLDDQAIREHLLCGLTLGLKLGDLNAVAAGLGASWDRLRTRPLAVVKLPPVSAHDVLTHLTEAFAGEGSWPAGDALRDHLDTTIRSLIAELTSPGHPLDLLETLATADIKCSGGRAPGWKAAGLDKTLVVQALKDADEARNHIVQGVGAAVTETLAARVQDWLLDESERRRGSGALGYHDLLVLARDVLREDPEVRQRLHDQWPTLLIDEFQDTDPIQAEIAYLDDPGGWADITVESGRLFFVGDAKQSIYRFRRADLEVFTAVGDQHVPARLKVNFRSVPGVLRAANEAFGVLIGQDPNAGIDYADLERSREAVGDIPPVLLMGGPLPGASASELRQLESAHLADVAVRAKREGWKIPGGTASYKDMAILLPTRTSLPTLERALQDRGVPYRIESRSLVWSTDAVRGLIAILQAVDSPADEVALIAALRNPGLACSDVDLVTWRAAGGRWSLFAPTPAGLADLAEEHPVASALATLRAWHQSRWWLPANQLVEQIVRELRLVELTASQRRPRDHWRRLRFVVDQSREWCDNGGSGLGSFVVWALQQMENDADLLETVVPETDDDAVRILTIHGAKGLEFPITMVAGLSGGAGRQSQVLWTDKGPQIRFRASKLETSGWGAAVLADKEAARREGIRLLYVAATRAMDHLVLGCYHAPPVGAASQRSSAQQLWDLLSKGDLARIESGIGQPLDALEQPPVPPPMLPARVDFAADRQRLLDAVSLRVATSPTSLAVQSAAAAVVLADETALEPDNADEDDAVEPTEGSPTPAPVWRSSSKGKAIGTATHRVLELVNLKTPNVDEVRSLARLACAEQGIPELQANIEERVWSALHDDALQNVLAPDARTLSEVYLVVQDGERFLEGYIDLLVDGGPGSLAILDYKTDKVASDAEIEAKKVRYAPQLTAYARAVEQITGRTPSSMDLVFARPGGRPTRSTPGEPDT